MVQDSRISGNLGSGLRAESQGKLELSNSEVSVNKSFGLYLVEGEAKVAQTKFSGNKLDDIHVGWEGTIHMEQSTISIELPKKTKQALKVSNLCSNECNFGRNRLISGESLPSEGLKEWVGTKWTSGFTTEIN